MAIVKTLTGVVAFQPEDYGRDDNDENWRVKGMNLSVWSHEMDSFGYVTMAPATITFEIPDNWDPRQAIVEILRKKRQEIRADFQKRMTEIEGQISKYLAIGQ